jgi:hypothetical protein
MKARLASMRIKIFVHFEMDLMVVVLETEEHFSQFVEIQKNLAYYYQKFQKILFYKLNLQNNKTNYKRVLWKLKKKNKKNKQIYKTVNFSAVLLF